MNDEKRFIFVSDRKYYYELDGIRLVIEDDKIVGWYRPDIEEEQNENHIQMQVPVFSVLR